MTSLAKIEECLLRCSSPSHQSFMARTSHYFDAANSTQMAREMEYVYKKTYDREFAELAMGEGKILPFDQSIPAGHLTYVYYSYEGTGKAKYLNAYAARDLPRVGISRTRHVGSIKTMGNSWGYNIEDLKAAALNETQFSLDKSLADAAKRGHVQLRNETGLFGDAAHNLPGLLNHPSITQTPAPDDGSGNTTWRTKAPLDIIADFSILINTIPDQTTNVHNANRVLLPGNMHAYLRNLPADLGNSSNVSVLKYVQDNYNDGNSPNKIEFGILLELRSSLSAGNLSTDYALAYHMSEDTGTLVVPQMFEQMDPDWDGLEVTVATHSSCGGVKLTRELAYSIMTGIDVS